MHNEDLLLAPRMRSAATTAQKPKGRKTVLIEPMQGTEVQTQTGETVRQKMRVDGLGIFIAEANVAA